MLFNNCSDVEGGFQTCVWHSSIPIAVSIFLILLKVICLRNQRIVLWSGFCLCLVAQIIVLIAVKGDFEATRKDDQSRATDLK